MHTQTSGRCERSDATAAYLRLHLSCELTLLHLQRHMSVSDKRIQPEKMKLFKGHLQTKRKKSGRQKLTGQDEGLGIQCQTHNKLTSQQVGLLFHCGALTVSAANDLLKALSTFKGNCVAAAQARLTCPSTSKPFFGLLFFCISFHSFHVFHILCHLSLFSSHH